MPVEPASMHSGSATDRLEKLAARLSVACGDAYFEALVQGLGPILDVAIVGELSEDNGTTAIHTVSVWVAGDPADNFSYSLPNTPCATVIETDALTCLFGVQERFPKADFLRALAGEGYTAVALRASDGDVIGILALVSRSPVSDSAFADQALRLFAPRTGAELERRKSEGVQRRREAMLLAALDALPVGVRVADPAGKVLVRNSADAQIWVDGRFNRPERLGAPAAPGVHGPEDLLELADADGNRKSILNSVRPLFDEAGRLIGAVELSRDLTAQRETELALRKREAELAHAQRIARLGHWDWDITHNQLSWSDEIYRMFGLEPQAFGATYEAFINHVHPDDRDLVQQAVYAALQENVPYSIDHRIVDGRGETRIVHEEAVVTFSDEQKPVRMFGTVQDITERKEIETALRLGEQQYRYMMAQASDAIFVANQQGKTVAVNARGCELLGYEEKELLNMGVQDFLPRRVIDEMFSGLAPGDSRLVEKSVSRKDGTRVDIELSIKVLEDGRILGIGRDVTSRRAADAEMRKLSSAVEHTADTVMITDRTGKIEYVNRAFERVTRYTREEAVGSTPRLVKSNTHGRGFYRRLWTTILAGEVFREIFVNRKKTGELYYEEKTITPIKDADGEVTHFVGTGKDITDRMQAQERLEFLAHHDSLTRLPNRVLFMDRLERALKRSRWRKRIVSVLFLDLDRFKNINDTLGHNVGDMLLQLIADRISGCLRDGDTVARFGGDEFAVLLEDIARVEDVSLIADKILGIFASPVQVDQRELFVTTSIGISLHPRDGDDALSLLKHADAAMYRAKEQGRNTYQFYSKEMSVIALERLTVETELRRALDRGEFVLYYQPQINAVTGQVTGVEALIRWRHPERGLLSPAHFLQVAEETGLISLIDEWVAHTACGDAARWARNGTPVRVAVNLSGRRFNDATLVEFIRQVLEQSRLDPGLLELEITEGVIMQNAQLSISRLNDLHDMGIRFAIDDFGTGYSSLSYLRRFPISTLKIDKSFIHYVPANEDDAQIVRTIIAMAHSLRLGVIAEGVETAEQASFLAGLGCDLTQGFFFSVPLPADEVATLIRKSVGTDVMPV